MVVRKVKVDRDFAVQPGRMRPAVAGDDAKGVRSPALELQAQLSSELAAEGRWPPIATLAFVFGTCGGFWAAVAWGAARLAQ